MCPLVPFPLESRGSIEVARVPSVDQFGVDAFVTTRNGGVSSGPYATLNLGRHVGDDPAAVDENHRRLESAIDAATLHRISQVHGADVLTTDECGPTATGDAIVVTAVNEAVAVLVADCTPLLLVHPESHQLAVVHAGWRGLAAGVIEACVARMGVAANQLTVAIGPAISGQRYQVGPEVIAASPHFAAHAVPDSGDRSLLDTRAVATSIVRGLGVHEDSIIVSSQTTDEGDLFFSDRTARPCGRFALVAKWRS